MHLGAEDALNNRPIGLEIRRLPLCVHNLSTQLCKLLWLPKHEEALQLLSAVCDAEGVALRDISIASNFSHA